ncbi:MAG: NIPSNAP family protein [Gammaproteobacteria bacterium]|nr:NIPSNAP family protein [Gammaproteobacteria bacterium]
MAVWLQAVLTLAPTVQCQQLAEWLEQRGRRDLALGGGRLWGLWDGRPGLGFGSDEAILMSVWPDDASAGAAVETIKAMPQVLAVSGTPLHPTLRPQHDGPVSGAGAWVFRDFHLAVSDLEAFLTRSAAAWDEFEATFDSEVVGLFRCPNLDAGTASLLLITRYADLDAWERSRSAEAAPKAWQQLGERHALTRWTRARSASRQLVSGEP